MNIENIDIEKVIPYHNNPRKNQAIDKVASSIAEYGFQQPIVVDKNMIVIVGHTRLLGAKKLGLKQVPVQIADLSESKAKAYRIADNRLNEDSIWDFDLLDLEVKSLLDDNYNIDLLGFDSAELDKFLKNDEEYFTDDDEVPEPPKKPKSKLGDIYELGKHKIICGDATDIKVWEKLQIEKGIICFTSPPYNLGESIKLSGNTFLNKKNSAYSNYQDKVEDDDYLDLIKNSLNCSLSFCEVSVFNLQPLAKSKRPLMNLLSEYSSKMIDIITWDKGHSAPAMAKNVMSSRYEWLFLYSNKKNPSRAIPYANWRGKFSNVYQAPPQRKNEFAQIHGATFPVHLPEFVVGDLMNKSRGVVDCFCGSGTSIIASEKLGRIGYGIELDPVYIDVIIQRWENYTGKKAKKIN